MRKTIITFVLALFLLAGTAGCAVITSGTPNFEVYSGVRSKPGKVEIKSTVVEKIIDRVVGSSGQVSDTE